MPILPSELVWKKSQVVADNASNGGRMSTTISPTGVKNNIFPDVSLSERASGIRRYRKMFIHVANDDDLTLSDTRVFVQLNSPGEDSVTFFPGTQRDTQANINGTQRLYGGGRLTANVAAGSLTFNVNTEGAALNYLRTGDLIRISDKTSVSATGNEEFVTATNVTYAGDVATITIASPGLSNSYAAPATGVASVYSPGAVKANVTEPSVVSAAGTIDFANHPIVGDNLGTVEQDWTISFTSATAFNIVGDVQGNVGSGNTTSGAQPGNPAASGKPYFVLPASLFGGTFATGDAITFTTDPAAVPIWYQQDVPAGAASLSGDRVIVAVDGASA